MAAGASSALESVAGCTGVALLITNRAGPAFGTAGEGATTAAATGAARGTDAGAESGSGVAVTVDGVMLADNGVEVESTGGVFFAVTLKTGRLTAARAGEFVESVFGTGWLAGVLL